MAQILNKTVGPIGYGMMGLSWRPDPIPIEKAIEALKAAIDNGASLWNAAEFYGTPEYNSMTVLNAYFTKYPEDADKVTLMIKGAIDPVTIRSDGSPESIRRSADNILAQLDGKKKLDIFVYSRRDPRVPLATTLRVLKEEYVDTGKIGGIAISECSAETIREAAKITKIEAAEVELSMFTPDILHNGVAEACAENNITVVAYSPIGRGILTGRFKKPSDAQYLGRIGQFFPRFQADALARNQHVVDKIGALAAEKGCSPAQLALAWVRSVSRRPGMPSIIPIPGSTTVARVHENTSAIELSDADVKAINDMLEGVETAGSRYPEGTPTET